MKQNVILFISPLLFTLTFCSATWRAVEETAKYAVINVHAYGQTTNRFEPFNTNQPSDKWSGSAFFIDSDGYFLTNYHVAGKTKRLEISLPSLSRQRFPAELVGCKPARDVALCRLTPEGKTKFQALLKREAPHTHGHIQWLPLARENKLNPAEEVMALGYPLTDEFKRTIGHVSGLALDSSMIFCQISAAINPGNSGGPTVNSAGEVIGINTVKLVGVGIEGTGYMSPVHTFRHLIDALKKHRILHCDLGISFQPTTENIINALQCPTSGVYISHAPVGCFGYAAGFRVGDIIMKINDTPLDNDGLISTDWIDAKVPATDILDHLTIGAPLVTEVWRNNKTVTIKARFPAYTAPTISVAYPESGPLGYRAFGGLVVQELRSNHIDFAYNEATRSIRPHLLSLIKQHSNAMEHHLIVTRVFDGSQAEQEKALYPGVIITHINNEPVQTLDELDEQLRTSESKYIMLHTADGHIAALDVPTMLSEDQFLREEYRYAEAPGITALRGSAHYL